MSELMQKILVCTGGSLFGEWAVQLAVQLAKGLQAQLTVLTVQDPKDPVEVQKIQERSRQILKGFAVPFDSKVRKGHPAQEILSESLQGYDMVILGSHGTRGILEFFLGDTAVHVVEHLRISTLVVRQKGEVSKILLPLRLGKEKREIIRMAGEMTRATQGSLTILYVVPMPVMYGIHVKEHRDLFDRHPLEANYLRRIAAGLEQEYGIRPVLKMRQGVPEEEILEETVEEGHDLVIVGSSAWGGLSSLLLGNFSYTIVKHAKTSVLVAVPKKSP
jgi:nucleotide-binding universal stress UspA family protein